MALANTRSCRVSVACLTATLLLISVPADSVSAQAGEGAFLPRVVTSSTVPANGDLNPYGVAFVPQGFPSGGKIAPGDVLISNFNNAASNVPGGVGNVQGTGTTIVKLTPDGTVSQAGALLRSSRARARIEV